MFWVRQDFKKNDSSKKNNIFLAQYSTFIKKLSNNHSEKAYKMSAVKHMDKL